MRDELEKMVDKFGLDSIIEALREICILKADHLRVNWQDEPSAENWERKAELLDELSLKI